MADKIKIKMKNVGKPAVAKRMSGKSKVTAVGKTTTALLLDERGYYWMWHNFDGKPQLSGPHPEPMLNLKPIKVKNPLDYSPK